MCSEIMHVSRDHRWEMWWVSTAGLSPIRESTEWQQTEQLSKVAMHDPALEHQPQPNSSPYLLTVPFGELTLFYLSLFLALSLPLHPPLSSWQCKRATSVDSVMSRWVSLSHCIFSFHFILSSSLLLPVWTSVFYLFPPLKAVFVISCHLFNSNSYLSQAGFICNAS